MISKVANRHWKIVAFRLAMLIVSFTGGWFCARSVGGHTILPPKGTVPYGTALIKYSQLSSSNALTKARTSLVQALRTIGTLNRKHALYDYVAKLDAGTVKALLADIAAKPLPSNNSDALSALSYRWGELDPEAAIAWLQGLHNPSEQNVCAGGLFDAYSAKDPIAALNSLAKLPGSFNLIQLNAVALTNFAQQDPQAALVALQNLQNLPNGVQFENSAMVIFQQWAQMDPATAAAAALKLPDGITQGMSLQFIAKAWAQQDPAAALAWTNTLSDGLSKNFAMQGALQTIGQQDPTAAAAAVLNISDTQQRGLLLQSVTSNWAQQDPVGLLTWADQNLTGAQFDRTALAALNQMGQANPASAAAALTQLSDPNVVNRAIPALASNWAEQDPQAALAWAQSLPPDNIALRNSAINGVFANWISADPAAAAADVQQNLATDPSFSAVASHLASTWAGTEPQAALNWAERLPAGAQGPAAVAVVLQMTKADPQSAVKAAQNVLANLTSLTDAQQTVLQKIVGTSASP